MKRYSLLALVIAFPACENTSGATAPGTPDPITGDYTFDQIDTLLDLFFADPEGGAGQRALTKWTSVIALEASGEVTVEDEATLRKVVHDINCAAGREVIEIVEVDWNVSFLAVPGSMIDDFAGFTHLDWNSFHEVISGRIRIAQELTGDLRRATIRHELMHSLGPLGHVQFGPSTLKRGSSLTWLTPLDQALIEMLYNPRVQPGMDRDETFDVLRTLKRPVSNCSEGDDG